MNARLLLLLAASASTAVAATSCPVSVQSRTTSTLTDPITKVVSSISSASGSDDSSDSPSSTSGSDFTDAGSRTGSQNADVGSSSSSSSTTSAGSTGTSTPSTTTGSDDSTGSAGTTTAPSSTTRTPTSTTKTPSSTTAAPTVTTATDTTTGSLSIGTTDAPTTTTTPTTTTSSGSAGLSAGTTPLISLGVRRLQAVGLNTGTTVTAGTPITGTATAGTTTTGSTTTGGTGIAGTTGTTTTGTTGTTVGGTTGTTTTGTTGTTVGGTTTTGSTTTSSTTTAGSSSTSVAVGSGSSTSDELACDSSFYSTWDTLGLKCGGSSIDVASAVSASSCVIYSGSVGSTSGSSCVSICSFPACTNDAWVYGGETGISSSVYNGLSIQSFLSSDIIAALQERSSTVSTFLSNSTMSASQQCSYASEDSFSSCSCSAMLIDRSATGSVADAAKKEQREKDEAFGVITKDNTTTTGQVVAATSKSVAGVTVAVTGIAAIASTAVGGVSSAGASLTAAGSTMAITTVEICQFGVLVNQLQLEGKSSALAQFGKAMAPAAFTFLPFGTLKEDEDTDSSAGRRLSSSSTSGSASSNDQLTGIAKYSRQLNIEEDMLFLVTLAGVFCVMAGVVGLFGLGYLLSGLMMPRDEYLTKFFDKMIGLEVLVAILSQYTIGVTATFQIYYSTKYESITDPKCLLAIAAIIFLAAGILVYGYIVIKKHEADIADVGTVQHMKKTVNMRYGPLYEEYKYKNRYFFAAKMMLALTTGVITGCASMSGKIQVALILALNVVFFFYLEIQSPHHSKFVQTTTSFVSIMKIAVLVLTFFLVTAAASDGFPTSLQNGISVAIVGLNLFVLALLMVRSLYTFWQKLKLQRDAAYDQEEQTAQDYFKDETPAIRKDGPPSNAQQPSGLPVLQSQNSNVNNNPYVQDNGVVDYSSADEIRLRSATHEKDNQQQTYDANRRSAANHYITQDRNNYGERRNDVVEL